MLLLLRKHFAVFKLCHNYQTSWGRGWGPRGDGEKLNSIPNHQMKPQPLVGVWRPKYLRWVEYEPTSAVVGFLWTEVFNHSATQAQKIKVNHFQKYNQYELRQHKPGAYLQKIASMAVLFAFYIYYLLIISPGIIHFYVYYMVFAKLLQENYFKNLFRTFPYGNIRR